jgi:hypothetical protein
VLVWVLGLVPELVPELVLELGQVLELVPHSQQPLYCRAVPLP